MKLFLTLSFLLATLVGCANESNQATSQAEYDQKMVRLEEKLDKAIVQAIDADTQNEAGWDDLYYESLSELQGYCTEHRSEVIGATLVQVQKNNLDGQQFAWLNMVEESLAQVKEQAPGPVECVPVIEDIYY